MLSQEESISSCGALILGATLLFSSSQCTELVFHALWSIHGSVFYSESLAALVLLASLAFLVLMILDTDRSTAAGGNLANSGTKRGEIANDGDTFFVFVFCELDYTSSEASFWNCNCAGLKFGISGSLYRS